MRGMRAVWRYRDKEGVNGEGGGDRIWGGA